jgi:hypothetical protein
LKIQGVTYKESKYK